MWVEVTSRERWKKKKERRSETGVGDSYIPVQLDFSVRSDFRNRGNVTTLKL